MQEGLITPSYTYTCNHVYTFYEDYQPTCLGWHPNFTVMDALRVSCNIFFYDLGRRLGIDTLVDYASQFGLGEPTGIELPEAIGHMSSPEYSESIGEIWNPGDVLQTSIGQSKSLFTPLQLATYTATLANGGVRMKTHLVKSIKSYALDETVEDIEPEVVVDMGLSETAVSAIRDGMIRASGQNGYSGTSGAYFGDYPISVASKTGTPETPVFPTALISAMRRQKTLRSLWRWSSKTATMAIGVRRWQRQFLTSISSEKPTISCPLRQIPFCHSPFGRILLTAARIHWTDVGGSKMQKLLSVVLLILLIIATLTGCQTKSPEVSVKNTIDTGVQTYCEMSDGTWQCDGRSYQYRLEISGRTPQAAVDSTFVYLSNLEEIPFEQAWKAAGFSSSSDDYFSPEDAVLVEWRTE